MSASPTSLTYYEEMGLSEVYNLADGHAHQGQTRSQLAHLKLLPKMFATASGRRQHELESEFKRTFFELASQATIGHGKLSCLSYSASMATEIVAHYLRRHGLSVALIQPAFDNIAAILRRVGVPMEPMDEGRLQGADWLSYLEAMKSDAIFLVCPNNPTGWTLGQPKFSELVEYCRVRRKTLILDFCFRFFEPRMFWDQYAALLDAGIDFLAVEDTGKTWPTLDLKVGITTSSPKLYDEIRTIHQDMLLNVSPFVLQLLIAYLNDSREVGIESMVRTTKVNRRTLVSNLRTTPLRLATESNIGVAWLQIDGGIPAKSLWSELQQRRVFVLPGNDFYWSDPALGSQFIRVALMRPTRRFREAVGALRTCLLELTARPTCQHALLQPVAVETIE